MKFPSFCLLLLLVSVFSGARGFAQVPSSPAPSPAAKDEPDFIVPARPTVSNPAEFQRPGVLQLEFGFNSNFHASNGASQEDFPLALRFAASQRVLFEIDLDDPLSAKASGVRATGFGDTQVGVQGVLQPEQVKRPGIALAYYIKLPSASSDKGLGTGRVDHSFIGLISKKIHHTTMDFNAIYLLAGRTTSSGHASSGQSAFAVSQDLTDRWGIQGELSGFTRNDAQPGAMFALAAVTRKVNWRLVLDGGLRCGLTPMAPRVGAFAGLTVGLGDLYGHRHHS
jgi:Putative MetA-pathway of phenol degradation